MVILLTYSTLKSSEIISFSFLPKFSWCLKCFVCQHWNYDIHCMLYMKKTKRLLKRGPSIMFQWKALWKGSARLQLKDPTWKNPGYCDVHSPKWSAAPITAMGRWQCLHLSMYYLKIKDKHCRNGVVDHLGHTACNSLSKYSKVANIQFWAVLAKAKSE